MASTSADAATAAVLQALQSLYHDPDPAGKRKANDWLQEFQHSVSRSAWFVYVGGVDITLVKLEKYYAANVPRMYDAMCEGGHRVQGAEEASAQGGLKA
jgi:hypothetical protein